MMAKPQVKANQTEQKKNGKRPVEPMHQGPLAEHEEPDLLALQRAVANPAMAAPADILALGRRYGNQAVQRLLDKYHQPVAEEEKREIRKTQDVTTRAAVFLEGVGKRTKMADAKRRHLRGEKVPRKQPVQRIIYMGEGKYNTNGGDKLTMEAKPSNGPNCHGHTYGTWKKGAPWCPEQWAPGGVKKIVQDEAGNELDTVKVNQDYRVNPPSFNVRPAVGNLIVVWDAATTPVHSAKVVKVKGISFADVTVSNKWGYVGAINKQTLSTTMNLGGKRVKLYPNTPQTRLDVSVQEKMMKAVGLF